MILMKKPVILIFLIVFTAFIIQAGSALAFKLTNDLKDEIDNNEWLVKVHPKDPQSHFELAMTYSYSNRIEDGLAELNKVNELDPNYAKKAMKYYEKRAKIYPTDWKVLFRYAFSLYFNEKKKDAISEFQQVIKLDPKNVFAYGYIAIIYGELNDIDSAIDSCKKAITIDSNVAAIHLLLGTAYYKKGQSVLGFQETFEALRLRALGY